jgi:hypothetical protein
MSIGLACAGRPRSLPHFQTLHSQLMQVYDGIIISVPPDVTSDQVRILESLPHVIVVVNPDWSRGRLAAIQKALDIPAAHIHYADLDRILYWVETDPAGWDKTIQYIQETDCLIIGRTEKAFQTHPQAIQQTERIINHVFSSLLGRPVDLGGGSRGFSARAAQYLVEHSRPGSSWCSDSEWVMLLHRAGFSVDSMTVDGLASPGYPTDYDADAKRWEFRVQMALDIIRAGIASASPESV